MADDDPNGLDDEGAGPTSEDAQIFDDLTVLSDQSQQETLEEVEGIGASPQMAEGNGLENVQPGDQTEIAATLFVDNTGGAAPEEIEIPTSETVRGIPLPNIEAGSEGGEAPTPDVDQPLPDDFIELDRQANADTPELEIEPEPLPVQQGAGDDNPEDNEANAPGENEPEATEPPVTEPPVTEPPTTEPPTTEPPTTEPPTTEPPTTEPPTTEPPPPMGNN